MSAGQAALTIHRVDAGDAAARTVARIQEHLHAGAPPAAIAVLARVTSALLPVQVALTESGIGHTAPLEPAVLKRTGVRTALAYLRLGLDLERIRRDDLLETLNRPARKVKSAVLPLLPRGRLTLRSLEQVADALGETHRERFTDYLDDLRALEAAITAGADTQRCLTLIRRRIGLGEAVDALDASRSRPEGSSHGDDLDALEQLAYLQPRPDELETWLTERLRAPSDPAGVTLATVHKVKGRQWPHVVVVGASAGLFPHRLADDVEEERRVFHVAITRCQRSVDVVAESDRVSPFVDELAPAADGDGASGGGPEPAGGDGANGDGHEPAGRDGASPAATAPTARGRHDRPAPISAARFHADGTLVTAIGVAVRLPGGFDGRVTAADDGQVSIRLLAGPTVHVPYGSEVTVEDRATSLGPPAAAPAQRTTSDRDRAARGDRRGTGDPRGGSTGSRAAGPGRLRHGSGDDGQRRADGGGGPGHPRSLEGADAAADDALFEALRRWRAEVAARTSVPPYVVFHDRHLQLIAGRRPTTLRELAGCPGIGPTKLERYGDDLLALVAEHLEAPDDGAGRD